MTTIIINETLHKADCKYVDEDERKLMTMVPYIKRQKNENCTNTEI